LSQCTELFDGVAPLLRARPVIDEYCRLGGDWSVLKEKTPCGVAWFHIVTRGQCIIDQVGHGPLTIKAGDILLLPRGDTNVVRSANPSNSSTAEFCVDVPNAIRLVDRSLGTEETELICGRLEFEVPDNPLLAILPALIVMGTGRNTIDRIGMLLETIVEELDQGRLAGALIATELASVLFLMLLRLHLEESPPMEGLVALLAEPVTARAIKVLMTDLTRAWTLDELACEAGTSRATLVRSFRRLSGQTPLAFANDLRLDLAKTRLTHTRDSIAAIAADAGYQSEQAFSRAIFRRFGIRPGALRTVDRGN
jgi:AraC family transcriptional activator of mtrCDE